MASEKLQKILEMSKNMDKKGNKPSSAPKRAMKTISKDKKIQKQ